MSLASAIFLASVLSKQQPSFGSSPAEVLRQAKQVALKLTTKTEKSVAYLVLAQAHNKMGDKKAALASLDAGWKAYLTGSNKALSEGDSSDRFSLFDDGDEATLPVAYGVEFLVAGSLEKAKAAADALGDSDLAKAFRHDLGLRIRTRFPEAFEILTFTDSDREARVKRKQLLITTIDKVNAEPDISKRAFELYQLAGELERTNGKKEAIDVLHQAIALGPQVTEVYIRVAYMAQCADMLLNFGLDGEAKSLLAEAISLDQTLTGESKETLQAHFAVEQSKRSFGMPHDMDKVIAAMNRQYGVIPTAPTPAPTFDDSPYGRLGKAQQLQSQGDIAGAKEVLRKAKLQPDENGWWHVLVGELQTQLGDKAGALANLCEGSRLFIAKLRSFDFLPSEEIDQLKRIGGALCSAGDKVGGIKALSTGILKLAAGPDTIKIQHMGDGGNRMVVHDRRSATLHHGAIALAKIGAFDEAVNLARTIPGAAHRAIALAGIVRDFPASGKS